MNFIEEPEISVGTMPPKHGTLRRLWKTALFAATIAICLLISMVAAQTAGFDILGVLARQTDDVFTFETVQPKTIDLISSEAVDAHNTSKEGTISTESGRMPNNTSLSKSGHTYGIAIDFLDMYLLLYEWISK